MKKLFTKQKIHRVFDSLIKTGLTILMIGAPFTVLYSQTIPAPLKPVDEKRVEEIMFMLSDQPAGYGDPCDKRDVWNKLRQSGKYDRFLRGMDHFSFPPFSKEDYFSLSEGTAASSSRGLSMMRNRAAGLARVTWAECLENNGKYIKLVEDGLRDIINQKSWVSPRNDFEFKNYNGIRYSVELTSALYAHTIAQTLYMMGCKLSPGLKDTAINALYTRVFNPVLKEIETQDVSLGNRFLTATSNYNPVCLSGVVGAALAVIRDKHERAVFTCIGEYYSQNGLAGFEDDGYCTEGVMYFNYGFGHFILLRESVLQATGNRLDLFSNPKVRKIASYPSGMEIINGIYPSVSDSNTGIKPEANIMYYISRTFGMGLTQYDTLNLEGRTGDNLMNVMLVFPNSASLSEPKPPGSDKKQALRTFFNRSIFLICRPGADSSNNMGVAFKGGNNAEIHNHNDIGSYTIVLGNEIFVGDPGAIPYTADIFDKEYRYTYKTVGSYGHPVPLIDGQEQYAGLEARSVMADKHFTPGKDKLVMDISSAYHVNGLVKLNRTLEYSRKGKGDISFSDSFVFTRPVCFETAIITRTRVTKLSDNTILLLGKKEQMQVVFSSPGNKLLLRSEEIAEGGIPYTRIGIYFSEPVKSGQINISYEPVRALENYSFTRVTNLKMQ